MFLLRNKFSSLCNEPRRKSFCFMSVIISLLLFSLNLQGSVADETEIWKRIQERLVRELRGMNLFPQNPQRPFSSGLNGNFFYGHETINKSVRLPAWESDNRPNALQGQVKEAGTEERKLRVWSLMFKTRDLEEESQTFMSIAEDLKERSGKQFERMNRPQTFLIVHNERMIETTAAANHLVWSEPVNYAGLPGRKLVLSIDGQVGKLSGLFRLSGLGNQDLYEIITVKQMLGYYAGFELELNNRQRIAVELTTLGADYYRNEILRPSPEMIDKVLAKTAEILLEEFGKPYEEPKQFIEIINNSDKRVGLDLVIDQDPGLKRLVVVAPGKLNRIMHALPPGIQSLQIEFLASGRIKNLGEIQVSNYAEYTMAYGKRITVHPDGSTAVKPVRLLDGWWGLHARAEGASVGKSVELDLSHEGNQFSGDIAFYIPLERIPINGTLHGQSRNLNFHVKKNDDTDINLGTTYEAQLQADQKFSDWKGECKVTSITRDTQGQIVRETLYYDLNLKMHLDGKSMRLNYTPRNQQRFHLIDDESVDIPSLKATVTAVKFYEGGDDGVYHGRRRYSTSFSASPTRYIWWELNLKHPAPGSRLNFKVEAVYYNPDGSEFGRSEKNTYLQKDWISSHHTYGLGWSVPGKWKPGKYRVDLFIEGQKVACGEFEIAW